MLKPDRPDFSGAFPLILLIVAISLPASAYTVVTRSAPVVVDCGTSGTSVPTDWYFPQPNDNLGLVWVQHGFSRANNQFVDLSTRLAQQGYVVFATSLAPGTAGCAMNNQGFLSDFSRLFPDLHNPDVGLLKSAITAAQAAGIGLTSLPQRFAFTGHSAGAGSILWVARHLLLDHPAAAAQMSGLVLLDPVEGAGASLIADATPVIAAAGVPALTISSPPYSCNSSANGTVAFVNGLGRPFAGVRLTSGSHCDAEGSSTNFLCTAFCGTPQAENVSILQSLDLGWVGDFIAGSVTADYYPGGSYYQSKIASGRIVTLPEGPCGNGVLDAGEACDDGNRFDGDCCSGFCQFESAGSPCASDGNSCTDDVCNGAGTCTHPNNAAACDDGDYCTVGDICAGGVCGGLPRDCSSAGDACNQGVCDSGAGACVALPVANGTPCDDDNACTQLDSCVGGTCVGDDPIECPPSSQCHAAGACDPETGVCSNPPLPDGTPCHDANACTQSDTCQSGNCIGAEPVVCSPLSDCHLAGVCDPTTGDCSDPIAPNGTPCDDGDACTQTDTCQSGNCAGANPVACTPFSPCHDAGVCDPTSGACSQPTVPDGTPCDIGLPCVPAECVEGQCLAGSSPCGDGIVDNACGEECDDGDENGINHCCSAQCTVVDSDGDGTCDRDDPCSNGGPIVRAQVKARGLSVTQSGKMVFKGRAVLTFPLAPPLDPAARGLGLSFGTTTNDWAAVVIPAGAYDGGTRRGWRVNGRGDTWKFVDRSLAPPGGVRLVIVRDRSRVLAGAVDLVIKASVVSPLLTAAELPFSLIAVFDPTANPITQCAESDFTGLCALRAGGTGVLCR